MRLVIDLQGAQASNRDRGIGRYCLSLTRSMARLRGAHEVIVVLSALFPESVEPLRQALEEVLPPGNVRIMHLVGPTYDADADNDARRVASELVREQFFAGLNPDFVLIASLFEGFVDDAVTSIGRFSSRIATATVLYDLIPLVNRDVFLKNPAYQKWYERKLAHMRNSDLLLAISEFSRREAIEWLDVEEWNAVNISTAAEDHFSPARVDAKGRAALAQAYGLVRPFVMYTGGIDPRKNIESLIKAYARLPQAMRRQHQLAVVCSIQQADRERLSALAEASGLEDGELVLTGYLPESDLLACYRACKVFVFPSWHEGFGLPPLEAMKCGRAVIASDRSSLPEVIGDSEALFDPFDLESISAAIAKVLEDDHFRSRLERRALKQAEKFNWDRTARLAWDALTAAHHRRAGQATRRPAPSRRPRLAFFSPVPPANSGISDYSAELLPELARHYQIEVISTEETTSDPGIIANQPLRSIDWFKRNAQRFDRLLYHFGNSDFHSYMFDLLRDYPGVVVLHDFFLSGVVAHRDVTNEDPGGWARTLFEAHGWPALVERFKASDTADVVWAYPCSMEVLRDALGVVVHSDFSRQLARDFYGASACEGWYRIPHLRRSAAGSARAAARAALGWALDDFVVCSFGLLGPMKMNDRLLSAWLASPLASDQACHLTFVGAATSNAYCANLSRRIRDSRSAGRIEITGWSDQSTFRQWLSAGDLAVQLRTLSRGETSGTILDCMNAGLATVVNANGSIAELPQDCVWRMPDYFTDEELIEALTTLRGDAARRKRMGDLSRARIRSHHNPRQCADAYRDAIESSYARAELSSRGLAQALVENGAGLTGTDLRSLARSVSRNAPSALRRKRLFVDISELVQRDARSGIQRVVRSILLNCIRNSPDNYVVEPVYATLHETGYRLARHFTSKMLDIPPTWCEDELAEPMSGDVFLGLDLQPSILSQQKSVLQEWRRMGVVIRFVIYDLLPITRPEFFFPGALTHHQAWLETISGFDGVICISRAVANEFGEWLDHFGPKRVTALEIDWFHLGGSKETSRSDTSLPDKAKIVLEQIRQEPSFLTVATIEPRKGIVQTLDAMELLWEKGVGVNFVLVGKVGWMMEAFVDRLRNHPELGRRLFWLEGIDDDYLYATYEACHCLIAASEGEGFGLPLIEAAYHNLPVLARDLPVFREIGGDSAIYFPNTKAPAAIAEAVEDVIENWSMIVDRPPMTWLTWADSTRAMLACALRTSAPYRRWMPDGGTVS